MKIKIIKTGKKEYEVIAGLKKLVISETSDDWTNAKITDFLLSLASEFNETELELDIDNDTLDNDKIYNHICTLFQTFINEYKSESAK